MNNFTLNGVIYQDMPSTTRTQVPSFADFKMRGYWGGFASKRFLLSAYSGVLRIICGFRCEWVKSGVVQIHSSLNFTFA